MSRPAIYLRHLILFRIEGFISRFSDSLAMRSAGGFKFTTARGTILILEPDVFAERYGVSPPSLAEGPRLAGFTVGVSDTSFVEKLGLGRGGQRWIVPPERAFGTTIAFIGLRRQEEPHE